MEWSEMLIEVLEIIARKYITCYEDYPSFAGVCKSWRLAASKTYHNSNGPPSRFPCLMLAEKSDDHESRELFLLSNKSIRKIRLPEAYGKACRSSCGWLLTVGNDLASHFINPLSRVIINLPKLDTFPEAIYCQKHIAISKIVLLMELKLVLVIWGHENKLGFCHIGDNKWTCVEPTDGIPDFTFYNGQVYCLDYGDYLDKIQTCNVNGKDPAVLVDVARIPQDVYVQNMFPAYIVGLDDGERKQLLVIFKEGVFNDGKCPETYKTKSFRVLAYDLESGNWSNVKDFGRKTLFVGFSSSFWMEDTTGVIKGNCIYYTDDEEMEYEYSEKGGGRDMGIYHLSDGTIEPHFTGESRSHFAPPLWLQSV